jgi:acyl-CoA thioesterase-2
MSLVDDARRRDARMQRLMQLRYLVMRLRTLVHEGDDSLRAAATPGSFDRVYGGRLIAEAMMAAAATVETGLSLHAMHAQYLRVGDPSLDTVYKVERLHDTRTFSRRQVRAEQEGRIVTIASYSFSRPTIGISHQIEAPHVSPPEDLESRDLELIERGNGVPPVNSGVPWPFDIRHVGPRPWYEETRSGSNRFWIRADETLEGDPSLQACLLLFASDFAMPDAITMQHPIGWDRLMAGDGVFGASLDHSLWLHRPVRIDDWLLHEQESTVAHDGRGFTTGRFFDRAGHLVASVAQEVFIRETGERA